VAGEARKVTQAFAVYMKKNAKRLRYFYINDQLHKIIYVNRPNNQVMAWCYSERCRKMYQWSHIRKNAEIGYGIKEVSEMLNRSVRTLREYYLTGMIEEPERTYSLETGRLGKFIFSETDIKKIRETMMTLHRGRPRNDGMVVPAATLTKAELDARLNHGISLYTKTSEGKFVPVYEAENW